MRPQEEKDQKTLSTTPPVVIQNFNTATANPSQNQQHYPTQKRMEVAPPPKPNLKLISQRMAYITVKTDGRHDPSCECFIESSDEPAKARAAVATFRNQTTLGVRVPSIAGLRAHIIFRNAKGEEMGGSIPFAPWIGEFHNTVDMIAGESKTVLIGFCGKDALHAFTNRRSLYSSNHGTNIPDDGLEEIEVKGTQLDAEVQLLSYEGDVLLSCRFDIRNDEMRMIKRLS
jgi:hypothetical protein